MDVSCRNFQFSDIWACCTAFLHSIFCCNLEKSWNSQFSHYTGNSTKERFVSVAYTGFQVILRFRSLPTFFLLFPRKLQPYFSYFFVIKCQNNFSYQEKLGLQVTLLGGPQIRGLIKMISTFGLFCLFHSFTTLKQIREYMLFFNQMNVGIY